MNPNAGLALLRVVTGATFAAHGCMKLFQMGLPAVTGFFTQVGAPLSALTAPAVAFLEFGGGIRPSSGSSPVRSRSSSPWTCSARSCW